MEMRSAVPFLIFLSYLCGSIHFGLIFGKMKGIDIREKGSGNIGATNVARVLGKKIGLLVLLGDILKSLIVLLWLVPLLFEPDDWLLFRVIAGLMVILGHNFSVFNNFKGGKGVASALGAFLVLSPYGVLIAILVFLIAIAIKSYVSLGSICAVITLMLYRLVEIIDLKLSFFSQNTVWLTLFIFIILLLVVYSHRDNIKRIRAGTENKFSFKKLKLKSIQ